MQKNDKTDNELYLERTDLVPHIMSYDAFRKNNERNGAYWQMMQNPYDGRIPMVKFETMRPSVKDKINAFYGGNVYDYFAKLPIKSLVVPDAKAEQFYREYRYDNNKQLPADYQQRYTKAASWLNMMIMATETPAFIRKELCLTLDQFWSNVIDIIKSEKIALPESYNRLVSRSDSAIKEYKANGYQSLISNHFGNKRTAKIGKTEEGFCAERAQQQQAIIKKLARMHQNLDITQITSNANFIFERNGWATVSTSTVGNLVEQFMPQVISGRRGSKAYNNLVAMQVKRVAPDFPTYYWTLDGWTVEALYQENGRYDNRLVVVIVLDACNKYPVGYAIGERENTELIRMALRNAVIHMQDLFGATYRPWQLQSDNYGIKNLSPFYDAISNITTPAAVGNAKAKIIEPYFNYLNKKYFRSAINTSGHNITASPERQPNTEVLNKIKHSFPTKQGLIDQINKAMFKERQAKLEDYVTRWNAMPIDDQVTLTTMECIEVFGKAHSHFNTLNGMGLNITIGGQDLTYDSFDPEFRALQFSTRFKVMYDEYDLSQVVAITEDGRRKFLLQTKMAVGMGYKNTTPEQLEYRQQINDFNRARKEEILQTTIAEDALVAEIIDNTPLNLNNDEEAALKLMFTDSYGQQKERLQDAKRLKQIQQQEQRQQAKETRQLQKTWEDTQADFRNQNTDFSQYL